MTAPHLYTSDIAFTPTVKAIQTRKGSRRGYKHMEETGSWKMEIFHDLKDFIEAQRSVYLASVNAEGQPYIQHRGGPPGFLKVLDNRTIALADFTGNRQFITQGNVEDNPKVHLFLMDYAHKRRVKIWGHARFVEGDDALNASLMPPDYHARPEQALLITVDAWDANCPQHIPQRFEAEDVRRALAEKDAEIAALTAEVKRLKAEG